MSAAEARQQPGVKERTLRLAAYRASAYKAAQETGPLLFWCLDARRSPGSIEIPNGKWDSG
jgi:hypothetical protein